MQQKVYLRGKIAALFLTMLILAGCQPPAAAIATSTPNIRQTQQTDTLVTLDAFAAATSTNVALSPQPTGLPTYTPSPTLQPIPEPGSLTDTSLTEDGPWWFFLGSFEGYGGTYFFAMNGDGTGLTLLSDKYVENFAVRSPTSPEDAVLIAYVSRSIQSYDNLSLELLRFPDNESNFIARLISPEIKLGDMNAANIDTSITMRDSLKWSPDGKWLAFVAAIDGPTSDVYSYSVEDGTIRQLTSGPTHAWQLLWSPDSQWIAHTGSDEFHIGGSVARAVRGAWVVSPDNAQVVDVLRGESGAKFVGWLTPDSLLIHNGDLWPMNLRSVDIRTGAIDTIWQGVFSDVAYDFENQLGLLSYSGKEMTFSLDDIIPSVEPGTYLIKDDTLQFIPYRLGSVGWAPEIGRFVGLSFPENQIMTVDSNGEVALLSEASTDKLPVFAPGGDRWIWNDRACCINNLWISSQDEEDVHLGQFDLDYAIWSQDGTHILLINSYYSIYIAQAPAFKPHPIDANFIVNPNTVHWPPTWVDR